MEHPYIPEGCEATCEGEGCEEPIVDPVDPVVDPLPEPDSHALQRQHIRELESAVFHAIVALKGKGLFEEYPVPKNPLTEEQEELLDADATIQGCQITWAVTVNGRDSKIGARIPLSWFEGPEIIHCDNLNLQECNQRLYKCLQQDLENYGVYSQQMMAKKLLGEEFDEDEFIMPETSEECKAAYDSTLMNWIDAKVRREFQMREYFAALQTWLIDVSQVCPEIYLPEFMTIEDFPEMIVDDWISITPLPEYYDGFENPEDHIMPDGTYTYDGGYYGGETGYGGYEGGYGTGGSYMGSGGYGEGSYGMGGSGYGDSLGELGTMIQERIEEGDFEGMGETITEIIDIYQTGEGEGSGFDFGTFGAEALETMQDSGIPGFGGDFGSFSMGTGESMSGGASTGRP